MNNARIAPIPAFAVILILSLAGCASTSLPWRNPDVPKDQWGHDYSTCRRYADREAGWNEDDSSPSSPFRDYDRQQAKARYDAALVSCMTDLGYVPVSSHKE